MPKYAHPQLSPPTMRAAAVFGTNAARIAVLSVISSTPGLTSGMIYAQVGLPATTAREHLMRLIEEGVVIADPPLAAPHSERRGQRPTYSVDRDALRRQWLQLGLELGLLDTPNTDASDLPS